jgi:ribose/xylose/arabinose/galactoside ABC-type transport system permease subunit
MTDASTASPARVMSEPSLVGRLRTFGSSYGTVVVAVTLFIVFGLTSSTFLEVENLRNILIQITVIGVVAIGETVVMLMGALDLSVGANLLFGSAIAANLAASHHSLILALPVAVLACAGIGALNGVLTAVIGVEPILATLGTFLVAGGLANIALHESFIIVNNRFFTDLAETHVFLGLPVMVAVMLALYALFSLFMKGTPFGRSIYAIGGNPRAARLVGLPTTRIRIWAFTLAGVCAGIAGLLQIGQLGIVSSTDATGFEFQAITAALVGGLSVTAGGIGRIERTLLGTVIVGMITNYQTIAGVSPNFQQAVLGAILLVAVVLDRVLRDQP